MEWSSTAGDVFAVVGSLSAAVKDRTVHSVLRLKLAFIYLAFYLLLLLLLLLIVTVYFSSVSALEVLLYIRRYKIVVNNNNVVSFDYGGV